MGISVFPAPSTGGATPQLRATYTSSQAVSLDVPRYCFFILAGGGGGGAGSLGNSASGGGGAAGVVAGKMLIKDFWLSIGVGGAATTSSNGNNGTSSYIAFPLAGAGSVTTREAQIIIARGGGAGVSATSTPGAAGMEFSSATTPTISGFATYSRMYGSSGSSGASNGNGSNNNSSFFPNINSTSYFSYDYVNGATENFSAETGILYINPFDVQSLSISTVGGASPFAQFDNTTRQASGVRGGGANSAGNSATRGFNGLYAGAGGGGVDGNQANTATTNRGGQGGAGMFYQGGLGGVSIGSTGQSGPAGGGGAGICAAGANGGNATASNPGGAGGAGGLGGGGGGGAGGGTGATGGKGGDGAFVIFY